jgi:FkbM family methyltransferase
LSGPKAGIRRYLLRGAYGDRFRDTAAYAAYLAVFYPSHAAERRRVRHFYDRLLEQSGRTLVFDIGANRGERTRVFRTLAERVVSVEPDPFCQRVLDNRFGGNPRVALVPAAVGAEPGVSSFFQFEEDGSGFNTLSAKWVAVLAERRLRRKIDVPIITLDALIAAHGRPDYIKIDVEGSELDVVRGLSTPVPLLSVECILPEFLAESLELLAVADQRFAGCRFNFSVGDAPQRLEQADWVSREAMAEVLQASNRRFLEVYCRVSGARV